MAKKSKSNTGYDKKYPWLSKAISLPELGMTIVSVNPRDLKENPKNWRVHGQRQRNTYKAFQNKHGWLGLVIFNLRTGHLLDGHMRVDEAIKADLPYVPVLIKDVPEEEENEILATLDNIGLLAQKNVQALDSLLKANADHTKAISTESDRKLAQLRKDLQSSIVENNESGPTLPQAKSRLRPVKEPPTPEPEDTPDSFNPTSSEVFNTTINSSVLFPGVTEFGIPELKKEYLATPDQAPTWTYTGDKTGKDGYYCYSLSLPEDDLGTVGFYTEDYRFTKLYSDPEEFIEWVLQVDPTSLILPDFSSYTHWPLAVNMFSLYKSRWCGRLWQEVEIPIIPTIQIIDGAAQDFVLTKKYVLETIPRKCPVVSLECRLDSKEDAPILIRLINLVVTIIKPSCVLLYAGEEKQKYIHGEIIRKGVEYRFLPQVITAKKRKRAK